MLETPALEPKKELFAPVVFETPHCCPQSVARARTLRTRCPPMRYSVAVLIVPNTSSLCRGGHPNPDVAVRGSTKNRLGN